MLQQPPFRFVHILKNWDEWGGETEFCFDDQTCCVEQDCLQPAGLVEYMAQSCSAWLNQIYIEHGEEVHFMPLCAVSHCTIQRLPHVGEPLTAKIHKLDADFGLMFMQVEVWVKDEKIAMADLKVGI